QRRAGSAPQRRIPSPDRERPDRGRRASGVAPPRVPGRDPPSVAARASSPAARRGGTAPIRNPGRFPARASPPDGEAAPDGAAAAKELLVQRVINCTGPNTGVEMCRSPLTLTLLTSGACTPDEVGIGLACDADGALMDSAGRVSDRLFTLGPLRKGELWESTAVPELRVQAERLARRLLGGMDAGSPR